LGVEKTKISLRVQKRNLGPIKSKIKKESKKKKKYAFQKMHAKKVFVGIKKKNKLAILECWSILKEKIKIVLKFFIALTKLNFLVLNFQDENKKLYKPMALTILERGLPICGLRLNHDLAGINPGTFGLAVSITTPFRSSR
jgi:hypothetical protein